MSKRFIDTGLFDDSWFMDLSKDAKLLWIYMITKCNHAGIIEINPKLFNLQTGIKSYLTVMKELGNRIITVKEHLFFIPKFIYFQYPEFPNSKVKAQNSAIEILKKYKLFNEENLTVRQELGNSYGNDNDNDNGNDSDNDNGKVSTLIKEYTFEKFWNVYDKKLGDKSKCEKKWNKLTDSERETIMNTLPVFLSTIKDKQYQPYPETYLNQRRWENELQSDKKINDYDTAELFKETV